MLISAQSEDELSYLYRNVTARTLSRDIAFLKQYELAVQEGDMLLANLEVMTRFTIPTGRRKPWSAR